jgi:hypothetical protein
MTLRRSAPRAKPRWLGALVVVAIGLLFVAATTLGTGTVGTAAGFEDDDGDLIANDTPDFDWNSFAPANWDIGTAPYRQSDESVSGWTFRGIEDAQVTTSDTAFAGGTKQDDDCPTINTGKAPNKDDLKRIYLASKVVAGHTYLMLAWVRIPQNTTSASAHIGFEFNKGTDGPCAAGSDGLVKRVAGDMLIVYDFEGGSADEPVITLRRWVTSGPCEVGSKSAPCWGTATNLTALGYAEAKVNTFGTVTDAIAPSPPDSLGTNEFGEAGIDLTAAEVFTEGTCESFGTAFGVSRSSGNSGTAQMKDLVGPADFTLANCGTVIIRKVTDPSGDTTTSFGYTTDVTTTPATTTSPFSLKDGESNTIVNVNPGTGLNVTEDDPGSDYLLTDIDCSASDASVGYSTDTTTRAVTFDLTAEETLDCTFTNTLQRGAIEITKTSSKDDSGLAGATFSITGPDSYSNSVSSGSDGTVCVDDLAFGEYTVTETAAPDNYAIDDPSGNSVTVDNNATCSDDPYVGEMISFSDTPLSEIEVIFRSLAGPGVTAASIVCEDSTPAAIDAVSENGAADPAFDDTDETFTDLAPGTYTCTIVVDP